MPRRAGTAVTEPLPTRDDGSEMRPSPRDSDLSEDKATDSASYAGPERSKEQGAKTGENAEENQSKLRACAALGGSARPLI